MNQPGPIDGEVATLIMDAAILGSRRNGKIVRELTMKLLLLELSRWGGRPVPIRVLVERTCLSVTTVQDAAMELVHRGIIHRARACVSRQKGGPAYGHRLDLEKLRSIQSISVNTVRNGPLKASDQRRGFTHGRGRRPAEAREGAACG